MRTVLGLTSYFLMTMATHSTHGADPGIDIGSLPDYGVNGFINGVVTDVDFATHKVCVYIHVEGLGWWTKPTLQTPCVVINANGEFIADVATGRLDNRATIYCAALLEGDVSPPPAVGDPSIPMDLEYLAMDCAERYARTFEFAGYTWAVKEAQAPVGPGANRFSDRPEDVFVDSEGLHLTINSHDGYWWATEVILLENLGYGTYAFQTGSRLDILDVNATFGAFTWDQYGDENSVPNGPNREIDFEDTRWGNPADPTNAQMAVQPVDVPSNLRRYTLPDLSMDAALTRFFTWQPEQIEFVALRGYHSPYSYPPESVIDQVTYSQDPGIDHFVPSQGREKFRLNLWLNNVKLGGYPTPEPADGQAIEVIITDFTFDNVIGEFCLDSSECLPSNEYCAKAAGDCGGIGMCTPRPDFCPFVYDPVCGCDGQTYTNACFAASAGMNVQCRGERPCAPDTDGDGIADNQDNCIEDPNGPLIPDAGGIVQLDTDGDGYGNMCDADLNNIDEVVNFADLALFKRCFGTSEPDCDFNGNGFVNFDDLALFKAMFGAAPGPSGLVP